jgi:hypothetical protein
MYLASEVLSFFLQICKLKPHWSTQLYLLIPNSAPWKSSNEVVLQWKSAHTCIHIQLSCFVRHNADFMSLSLGFEVPVINTGNSLESWTVILLSDSEQCMPSSIMACLFMVSHWMLTNTPCSYADVQFCLWFVNITKGQHWSFIVT